jgi:hypothetical protein
MIYLITDEWHENHGDYSGSAGSVRPGKKGSAYKTISFLVSSSENEPGTNCPDHTIGDEDDHAHLPDPRGN